MALKVKCKCGKIYEIKPEWLGKKLRCKKCDHVIVLPKTVPKKKVPQSAAAGTSSTTSAGPAKQSAHPAKQSAHPAKKRKAAVASGGLDDLLGGDLAALEQSAATVETTRKPPPKKAVSTAYTPGGGGQTSMDRKSAERAASRTGIRPPASTNFLIAIIAGVVAGGCGAAVWAAIAYYAHVEIGWIAWGIGAMVGIAMLTGGREGSVLLGACSVVIVVLSIVMGKYMSVQMMMADVDEFSIDFDLDYSDEELIGALASRITDAREEAGEEVDWPDVDYDDDLPTEAYYPPAVWREASAQWNDLGADGQQALKQEVLAETQEFVGDFQDVIAEQSFKETFGVMDLLFFGIAIAISFKITMGGIGD